MGGRTSSRWPALSRLAFSFYQLLHYHLRHDYFSSLSPHAFIHTWNILLFRCSSVPLHSSLHHMVKDVRLMLIWANQSSYTLCWVVLSRGTYFFVYLFFFPSCFLSVSLLALGPCAQRLFYPFGQSVTGLWVCMFLFCFLYMVDRGWIVDSLVFLHLDRDVWSFLGCSKKYVTRVCLHLLSTVYLTSILVFKSRFTCTCINYFEAWFLLLSQSCIPGKWQVLFSVYLVSTALYTLFLLPVSVGMGFPPYLGVFFSYSYTYFRWFLKLITSVPCS